MNFFNIYDTSYGSLINTKNIEKQLINFNLSLPNVDLSYGYNKDNNIKLAFLTGYHREESEVNLFNFPIVMGDLKSGIIIYTDLRRWTTVNESEEPDLFNMLKSKKEQAMFLIRLALIMSDFYAENFGDYQYAFKSLASAYGNLLATNIHSKIVMLNTVEFFEIELASAFFFNMLLTSDFKNIHADVDTVYVPRLLNTKFSVPNVLQDTIKNTISKFTFLGQNEIRPNITLLVETYKSLLPKEKASLLEVPVLLNSMRQLWYGTNTVETMPVALEHAPTFISVAMSCFLDLCCRKYTISAILNKFNNRSKIKDTVEYLDKVIVK